MCQLSPLFTIVVTIRLTYKTHRLQIILTHKKMQSAKTGGEKLMATQHFKPGEIANASGEYELVDSNGKGTGRMVSVTKGNRFPPSDKSGQYYIKK